VTAPKLIETLAEAERERDRLGAASREAGDRADKLAAEAWTNREAKRRSWAEAVMAGHVAEEARLAAAEKAAESEFRLAAVSGDGRASYLVWMATRGASNVERQRVTTARAAIGQASSEDSYVFHDQPVYSAELDRALSAEALARFGEASEALQHEVNALDELP
jgi:hypothetical protein